MRPTSMVGETLDPLAYVKPRLRGWLHAGLAPLALVGGIVLVLLSPDAATRAGSATFAATALVLFGVSAAYHRGTWSPRTWRVLRRLDHCNIYLLIAGSCTAYALLFLDARESVALVSIVWGTAALGVLARFLWPEAPRWLSSPIYVASGCAALFFIPGFLDGAGRFSPGVGTATLVLLAGGGVLYIAGAVVYGLQRPDPSPRWFGFHEVFHSFTVLAFASHYVGVSLATYSLR